MREFWNECLGHYPQLAIMSLKISGLFLKNIKISSKTEGIQRRCNRKYSTGTKMLPAKVQKIERSAQNCIFRPFLYWQFIREYNFWPKNKFLQPDHRWREMLQHHPQFLLVIGHYLKGQCLFPNVSLNISRHSWGISTLVPNNSEFPLCQSVWWLPYLQN